MVPPKGTSIFSMFMILFLVVEFDSSSHPGIPRPRDLVLNFLIAGRDTTAQVPLIKQTKRMIDSPEAPVCCPEKVIKSWVPPKNEVTTWRIPDVFFWFFGSFVALIYLMFFFFFSEKRRIRHHAVERDAFEKNNINWSELLKDVMKITVMQPLPGTVLSVINWKFLDDLNILPWCGQFSLFLRTRTHWAFFVEGTCARLQLHFVQRSVQRCCIRWQMQRCAVFT